LLSSRTVRRILDGEKEFNFFNACSLWSIPEIPKAQDIENGLKETDDLLDLIENDIKDNDNQPYKPMGNSNTRYSLSDIQKIRKMHLHFQEKFSDKIKKFINLTDARKHK